VVIKEYLAVDGSSPYREWFDDLNPTAAAKVTTAVTRLGLGNLSNVKSVGKGVHKCRINFGPGYRVYLGRDGAELIILLGGEKSTDNKMIYTKRKGFGQIIKTAKKWRGEHGTNKRF
jgi:putative addiction module killer protein